MNAPRNQSPDCDEFDAILPDLLDGTAHGAARTAAEGHAAACARCRGLRDDLAELSADAARLPVLKPSRDLWSGISARIETPAIAFESGRGRRTGARSAWRQAAAAAALVVTTAAVTWTVATERAAREQDALAATAAASSLDVATVSFGATPSFRVAAAYDAEIASLRQVLAERAATMDSATVQMLAVNLQAIDDAIARVRGALDSMPASTLLSQQLVQAYDMKLNTLRQVAALQAD